jgi:sortase A
MLSDRIVPALASVGLGCALLFTAGFARDIYSEIAGADPRPPLASRAPARPESGDLVARLSVARLDLDAPVFEGVQADTLARGAGHVPGTALPGDEERDGSSIIAVARGRNGAAVAGLRLGDRVRVTTSHGPHLYRVTERRLMEPATFHLAAVPNARITLLAPFPADSFGPAPMRVAVALERLGG